MVFACLKCGTRYRISDDLLKGKVLKFTCRKCGQVHLLRDPAIHPVPVERVTEAQVEASSGARHPTVTHARLTQSAPTVQSPATSEVPPPLPPTRELWYAIKHGQRVGPFTREALLEHLRSGYLHRRSYLWRPTMDSWKRLQEIPELATLLEQVGETPKPKEPSQPISGETPPPLPPEVTLDSRPVGRQPVDELFSKLSHPSIDLRRAREVPPEEPETPKPPLSPALPPEPEPQASSLAESAVERRFFSQAFSLPVQEALPEERKPEVHPIKPSPAPPKEAAKAPSLREFSVLVRLSTKSRRRTIILFSSLGALVVLVTAVVVYLASSVGPVDVDIVRKEGGQTPEFRQILYEVPKKPQTSPPPEEPKVAPQRPTASTSRRQVPRSQDLAEPPSEPTLASIGEVDPQIAQELQRYSGIVDLSAPPRPEPKVEVAPKTLTKMPERQLTNEKLDKFLRDKGRRFAYCKETAKIDPDVVVKVLIGFTVTTEGRVKDIVVEKEGPGAGDKLESCIRKIINGWVFPEQEEEVTVRTTLIL